jgi:hypothetical protein
LTKNLIGQGSNKVLNKGLKVLGGMVDAMSHKFDKALKKFNKKNNLDSMVQETIKA